MTTNSRKWIERLKKSYNIIRQEGMGKFIKEAKSFINHSKYPLPYYRIVDIIAGRCVKNRFKLNTEALYKISPLIGKIPSFYFWFDFNSAHLRPRVVGGYESECLRLLEENVNEDTTFWEVGAGWGYFSLALAPIVDQAVGFEPMKERRKLFLRSINENEFDNIKLCRENVKSLDDYVSKYGTPDVILMDVDGWEHSILSNTKNVLNSKPTLIIEVHIDPTADHAPDSLKVKPDKTVDILKEQGYDVDIFDESRRANGTLYKYHIIAK